jgi:two-component system CheB/CheR fusion protein
MEDAVVTTATQGNAALEAAAHADFDLLISDVGMPGMDGYQLISALRSQSRNAAIPAIALTGYGGQQVVERALNAGFTGHLCKPVPIDVLVSKVLSTTQTS